MDDLLGEIEVSEELLRKSAKNILADARKLKNYPFEVTEEEIMGL